MIPFIAGNIGIPFIIWGVSTPTLEIELFARDTPATLDFIKTTEMIEEFVKETPGTLIFEGISSVEFEFKEETPTEVEFISDTTGTIDFIRICKAL